LKFSSRVSIGDGSEFVMKDDLESRTDKSDCWVVYNDYVACTSRQVIKINAVITSFLPFGTWAAAISKYPKQNKTKQNKTESTKNMEILRQNWAVRHGECFVGRSSAELAVKQDLVSVLCRSTANWYTKLQNLAVMTSGQQNITCKSIICAFTMVMPM
jgi:hypothetical protein